MLWEDVKAREEKPPVRHPNRDLPESHTARFGVVALLLLSVVMLLLVGLGGWSLLVGAKLWVFLYAIVYLGFAYYVGRWNRGVLPVIAGLAAILAVFALVAGPDWFARDKVGYTDPNLPAAFLGGVTLALIPVQMLLIVVSMWGFNQKWNVEEEINPGDPDWPGAPYEQPQAPPPSAAPAS
ncbi:MAG: hypothetical protein QM648_02630 [Solirubrobacterales bacterium]